MALEFILKDKINNFAIKIVAISGGSCSGKTMLTRHLEQRLGSRCLLISQDDYYFDLRSLSFDGDLPNFDDPKYIDFSRLTSDLKQLKSGQSVSSPIYDFITHTRSEDERVLDPKPLIIVEGMFVLWSETLREIFDHAVFIDCKESLRLSRRLKRDICERGRTSESVKQVFQSQVAPSHNLYVAPTHIYADEIITQCKLSDNLDNLCDCLIASWSVKH